MLLSGSILTPIDSGFHHNHITDAMTSFAAARLHTNFCTCT